MGSCLGHLRGAVGAAIVDHDEMYQTVERLLRERSYRGPDHGGLVSRRYQDDNTLPDARARDGRALRRNAPEPAAPDQEVEPDENGNDGDAVQDASHQPSGSLTPLSSSAAPPAPGFLPPD